MVLPCGWTTLDGPASVERWSEAGTGDRDNERDRLLTDMANYETQTMVVRSQRRRTTRG